MFQLYNGGTRSTSFLHPYPIIINLFAHSLLSLSHIRVLIYAANLFISKLFDRLPLMSLRFCIEMIAQQLPLVPHQTSTAVTKVTAHHRVTVFFLDSPV